MEDKLLIIKKLKNEGYKNQAIIDKTEESKLYYSEWEKKLGKL